MSEPSLSETAISSMSRQLSEQAATIERLEKALNLMLDSAHPHRIEHDAMYQAWQVGRAALGGQLGNKEQK